MQNNLERYLPFGCPRESLSLLNRSVVLSSMRLVGDWLDAASKATGESGLCYRTAIFHDTGEITWLFPHSNTAELISAWLDLAEVLDEPRYREMALAYAERILQDPVRGLYRGEHREAHGLIWYWRDDGTYTGGYSMRLPRVFQRLHQLTGDSRYLDACVDIGRTFLARLLPSGLSSMVGWCPQRGWILAESAGCRYGYVVSTFASLFEITGDPVYRKAYEQAVHALLRMQSPDGGFFQTYYLETLKLADTSIKPHFFAYIFNALSEAYGVFQDARLIECAQRLAGYLAGVFYYRQQIPYCELPVFSTDLAEADSAVQDNAHGLLWLSSLTHDSVSLDMAVKLWMQAWFSQIKEGEDGWKGAIVRGVNPHWGAMEEAKTMNAEHLLHEPSRLARCEVWFATNYVLASKRLLNLLSEK